MNRDDLGVLIAHNIETQMDRRGMNPAELARRARLNPTGVYDILSGKSRSPRLDTLHKIALALSIPISSLLEEQPISDLRTQIIEAVETLPPDDRQRILATARAWAKPSQ